MSWFYRKKEQISKSKWLTDTLYILCVWPFNTEKEIYKPKEYSNRRQSQKLSVERQKCPSFVGLKNKIFMNICLFFSLLFSHSIWTLMLAKWNSRVERMYKKRNKTKEWGLNDCTKSKQSLNENQQNSAFYGCILFLKKWKYKSEKARKQESQYRLKFWLQKKKTRRTSK